jgi:hypothetical protein
MSLSLTMEICPLGPFHVYEIDVFTEPFGLQFRKARKRACRVASRSSSDGWERVMILVWGRSTRNNVSSNQLSEIGYPSTSKETHGYIILHSIWLCRLGLGVKDCLPSSFYETCRFCCWAEREDRQAESVTLIQRDRAVQL